MTLKRCQLDVETCWLKFFCFNRLELDCSISTENLLVLVFPISLFWPIRKLFTSGKSSKSGRLSSTSGFRRAQFQIRDSFRTTSSFASPLNGAVPSCNPRYRFHFLVQSSYLTFGLLQNWVYWLPLGRTDVCYDTRCVRGWTSRDGFSARKRDEIFLLIVGRWVVSRATAKTWSNTRWSCYYTFLLPCVLYAFDTLFFMAWTRVGNNSVATHFSVFI